ncbi:MAG: DUF427 domain-containing protein [Micromonosporaceae bacterium]
MATRAIFNGRILAESDDTVVVEGNHYFPPESLQRDYLTESKSRSLCLWKGIASYYTVTVDGVTIPDGAWRYRHPSPLARQIKNRVAFWRGVQVQAGADEAADELEES